MEAYETIDTFLEAKGIVPGVFTEDEREVLLDFRKEWQRLYSSQIFGREVEISPDRAMESIIEGEKIGQMVDYLKPDSGFRTAVELFSGTGVPSFSFSRLNPDSKVYCVESIEDVCDYGNKTADELGIRASFQNVDASYVFQNENFKSGELVMAYDKGVREFTSDVSRFIHYGARVSHMIVSEPCYHKDGEAHHFEQTVMSVGRVVEPISTNKTLIGLPDRDNRHHLIINFHD